MRIMETDRSLLGESRTGFLSHRECIEEEYEYANEFGKQGRKNPRNNIPKFTINHQRFCCAIEKISETCANAQSLLTFDRQAAWEKVWSMRSYGHNSAPFVHTTMLALSPLANYS